MFVIMSEYRLHALIRAPVGIMLEHSFINSTSSSNHLLNCQVVMAKFDMTTIAVGDIETLYRPCVDCGRKTGSYCDFCKAKDRVPSEKWAERQQTPFCTACDYKYDACHFCKELPWCTPPEHGGSLPVGFEYGFVAKAGDTIDIIHTGDTVDIIGRDQ